MQIQQTLFPGIVACPSRPIVDDAVIRKAAEKFCSAHSLDDAAADDIVEVFDESKDGYDMAKELDNYYGWSMNSRMVSDLDDLAHEVYILVRKAVIKWVEDFGVKPKLTVDTVCSRGVIKGFDEKTAMYKVKENGCTNPSRFLLLDYEKVEKELGV